MWTIVTILTNGEVCSRKESRWDQGVLCYLQSRRTKNVVFTATGFKVEWVGGTIILISLN